VAREAADANSRRVEAELASLTERWRLALAAEPAADADGTCELLLEMAGGVRRSRSFARAAPLSHVKVRARTPPHSRSLRPTLALGARCPSCFERARVFCLRTCATAPRLPRAAHPSLRSPVRRAGVPGASLRPRRIRPSRVVSSARAAPPASAGRSARAPSRRLLTRLAALGWDVRFVDPPPPVFALLALSEAAKAGGAESAAALRVCELGIDAVEVRQPFGGSVLGPNEASLGLLRLAAKEKLLVRFKAD
jgi:hypothetical protein